jgi:hypothetical protein
MTNFTMQVRDRFRLTEQALNSLAVAGLENMTVTILDDRSGPETRLFLELWSREHGAYLVRNETPLGTGQLRNMVISESEKHFGRGNFVAPHDNDCFFERGWLNCLIKAYRYGANYGFRLFAGYGHPYHLPIATLPVRKGKWVLFNIQEVQAIATQSTFMTWDIWDTFGPYCDTPVDKTCQSEDIDFTNKIRKAGFKLGVVIPHLVHATALKNTFGEPGPGWELVKAQCPEGVICE